MRIGKSTIDDEMITTREAVGVFDDDEHLRAAIDDLEMAEFQRKDFSVLGNEMEMQKTYGQPNRNPYKIEDDPNAPRGVYVMPEERSLAEAALVGGGMIVTLYIVGPLMAPTLDGAGMMMLGLFALMGGAAGYVLARGLRYLRQRRDRGQLRKGGLLLWVNTPTRELERKARDILMRHGAHDVHINNVMRSATS